LLLSPVVAFAPEQALPSRADFVQAYFKRFGRCLLINNEPSKCKTSAAYSIAFIAPTFLKKML